MYKTREPNAINTRKDVHKDSNWKSTVIASLIRSPS